MQHTYRADIDGLRAVAVVPVVLFHAGVSVFGGGYIGVDVFFVISGFLITTIIQEQIGKGSFSLLWFYERRARRILPALFFVILGSFVAGWFVSVPSEFVSLSESAIATILFGSNIYFWHALDYFSSAAEFHPLLHTWSLAVEEQFYIFFPLILMAGAALRPAMLRSCIVGIFVLSLAASIVTLSLYPSAAFYLLPTRAWELMCGAMLALGIIPTIRTDRLRETAAASGLALILLPMLIYDAETPFPGLAALPPCLGTMLLIHSGGGTVAGRLLSLRPIVFIGLISYSFYLMHWPVMAFIRQEIGEVELSSVQAIVAIALSFILAIFSWHFVEKPFRRPQKFDRKRIFQASIAGFAVAAGLSTTTHVYGGFPDRYGKAALLLTAEDDIMPYDATCKLGNCPFGDRQAEPSILFWGDSHAGALVPALDAAAKQTGLAGTARWRSACAPLLNIYRADRENPAPCLKFNREMVKLVRTKAGTIDTVVLAGRWALNATGERFGKETGTRAELQSAKGDDAAATTIELFEQGLDATVGALAKAGVRVVILGGVPEIGWNVPRTLAAAATGAGPERQPPTIADFKKRNTVADEIIGRVAAKHGADVIDLGAVLCAPECAVIASGRPLYIDDDHLSYFGAKDFLGPKLTPLLWPQSALNASN